MALWRDATAGALGPGQGDYDPYGDLSSLVRQIAPGIGSAAQTALQPQLSRPDDSFAAYMADPLARSDADIQQRAAAGPPSAGQSLSDLGNMVLPYLAGAAPGGSLSSGIRAYHGSPYDFDAFDASKIGTGEGAQAYGHGLYFAENEGVARSYKDSLGQLGAMDTLDNFLQTNQGKNIPAADIALRLRDTKAAPLAADDGVVAALQRLLPNYRSDAAVSEANLRDYRYIDDAAQRLMRGHMYEVDINADPQSFLHWDKPLSQQGQQVRDIITGRTDWTSNDMPGASVYTRLGGGDPRAPGSAVAYREGAPAASRQLSEAGIPGIRYLDQGSRGAGQGTSNYVVFDPKIIDILRKYAVPGLISGGAAASATSAGNP